MASVKSVPTLWFTTRAWGRLQEFLTFSKQEISGFAQVIKESPTSYLVTEVFLLSQQCNLVDTLMEAKQIAGFMSECDDAGIEMETIRVWWHSHHNMIGVSWSPTDDEQMVRLTKMSSNFWFGLLGWADGTVRARFQSADSGIVIDDIPVRVRVHYLDDEEREACHLEMAQKVTQMPPPPKVVTTFGKRRRTRLRQAMAVWRPAEEMVGG